MKLPTGKDRPLLVPTNKDTCRRVFSTVVADRVNWCAVGSKITVNLVEGGGGGGEEEEKRGG